MNLVQQHQHYKAVRTRIWTAKKREPPPLKLIERPPIIPGKPLWMQEDIHFNMHVAAWLEHRAAPVKSYIKSRCLEMDVSYRELVSGTRRRPIITVKHVLMFEVWQRFKPSYPELSRHFGLKDHTTALHAVEKFVKHGIHTFNRPEDYRDVLKDMWITGRSLRDMAAETGCAYSSINLYAKKQGWKRR